MMTQALWMCKAGDPVLIHTKGSPEPVPWFIQEVGRVTPEGRDMAFINVAGHLVVRSTGLVFSRDDIRVSPA